MNHILYNTAIAIVIAIVTAIGVIGLNESSETHPNPNPNSTPNPGMNHILHNTAIAIGLIGLNESSETQRRQPRRQRQPGNRRTAADVCRHLQGRLEVVSGGTYQHDHLPGGWGHGGLDVSPNDCQTIHTHAYPPYI